jgi:putative flippase GtrA
MIQTEMILIGVKRRTDREVQYLLDPRLKELIRYGLVGLTLNVLGYIIYLFVTSLGVSPIMTLTIFFPLSVIAGYFSHRSHTFRRKSQSLEGAVLMRYVVVYVGGYMINAALLMIFHQQMGYPHQLVQIFAMFVIVFFLFFTMKIFVFRN